MGFTELMSLFPDATKEDIERTKVCLERYQKAKKMLDLYPEKVTEKQRAVITDIERAIALILDDEVRKVIEYRYIKGHRNKLTLIYFKAHHGLCYTTTNNRLNEGVISIANSLKFCGQLD